MEKRNLTYIPVEYKLFDEIIVNALDQYTRMKETKPKSDEEIHYVKNIKINVDKASGKISVYNDG